MLCLEVQSIGLSFCITWQCLTLIHCHITMFTTHVQTLSLHSQGWALSGIIFIHAQNMIDHDVWWKMMVTLSTFRLGRSLYTDHIYIFVDNLTWFVVCPICSCLCIPWGTRGPLWFDRHGLPSLTTCVITVCIIFCAKSYDNIVCKSAAINILV